MFDLTISPLLTCSPRSLCSRHALVHCMISHFLLLALSLYMCTKPHRQGIKQRTILQLLNVFPTSPTKPGFHFSFFFFSVSQISSLFFPAITFVQFMARFGSLVLIFLVISASFVPQLESRKLQNTGESNKNAPSSLFASLMLSALAKGTVPASAPSKKGHSTLDNEKLFARHLAVIDRILQSVPSPGAGH